jgi:PAS domain S-box-containing protein
MNQMNPAALIGLISGILNACIGLYILILNPKKNTNRFFFLLILSITIYCFGEFFTRISSTPEEALLAGRIAYSVLFYSPVFFVSFSIYFPRKTITEKYNTLSNVLQLLFFILSTILYIIFLFFLNIQNVQESEWGFRVILSSSTIFIIIWYLFASGFSISYLFYKYFFKDLYQYEKNSIKIIAFSVAIVIIIAVVTNLLPPLLNFKIFPMTTIFLFAFAFSVAYAIKKYQFLFPTSELIAENILETMKESVIVLDKNDKIINVNKSAIKLLGYDKKNLKKLPLDKIIELPSGINTNFLKQSGKIDSFETSFITKSGKKIPMSISPTIIFDDEQNFIGLVLLGGDLTETKKSLKEKEILLKEIHHRVKNNLQLIHSLLDLQSDQFEDENVIEKIKESMNRIKLMASFYEQLYQSKNVGEINFKEYMKNILMDLFHGHKIDDTVNLRIEIEDIILDFDTALTCGFIVSELITNSLKHAFPDGRKGEISVGFHIEDNSYKLTIRDSGIGISNNYNVNNPKSFGLKLVNIFVKELGGNIAIDRVKGTSFTIIIPHGRKKRS